MKAFEIDFLARLARGIARQFGSNCEVVVHDMSSNDQEHSIVAIENGHVTGRRLGDGPSHVVWETLKADPKKIEVVYDRLSVDFADSGRCLYDFFYAAIPPGISAAACGLVFAAGLWRFRISA